MLYITNAFSLNMVRDGDLTNLKFAPLPSTAARDIISNGLGKSVVGHEDIARIIGVRMNRESVTLARGDKALVCQYSGPRLPEGATVLPAGASFRWILVSVL